MSPEKFCVFRPRNAGLLFLDLRLRKTRLSRHHCFWKAYTKLKSRCFKICCVKPRFTLHQRNAAFTVRPTVHTNPSWKRSFSKTLFKPEAGGLCIECGRKSFRKRRYSITIIMRFPWSNFPQTQIENKDFWLSRLKLVNFHFDTYLPTFLSYVSSFKTKELTNQQIKDALRAKNCIGVEYDEVKSIANMYQQFGIPKIPTER